MFWYFYKKQVEFGAWMIETTPSIPYTSETCFKHIYDNILQRQEKINKILQKDDYIFSISVNICLNSLFLYQEWIIII